MNITTPLRLLALAGLSLATFTTLSGCSDTESDASSSNVDDHAGHDHDTDTADTSDIDSSSDSAAVSTPDVYPGLLGEIRELPIAGDPSTSLKIHHQQIPNFKLKDGTVNANADGSTGMKSMIMPFPLSEGVSVEGLELNDKVKFTFAVDWSGQGKNAWEITKIEKIDASTVIDFSNKIEGLDGLKDAAQDAVDSAIDDAKDAAEEAIKDKMPDMPKLPGTTGP